MEVPKRCSTAARFRRRISTVRISIEDVARESGVSIATVSHALNGKGRISKETRARVLDVAARLGYAINPSAASLRTGQSPLIAIQISPTEEGASLVPNSSYFNELLNGASAAAVAAGYPLVVLPRDVDETMLQTLGTSRGIVVDPTGSEPLLRHLLRRGTLVTTGRMPDETLVEFPDAAVSSVDNDARRVTRTALRHLTASGYEHPAMLTSSGSASFFRDCVAELRAWAAEHDETLRIARLRQDNESSARRSLSALLDRYPETDAIFTTSEAGAIGCVTVAAARGRCVPDDFGIVAGMDTSLLKHFSPSITAIDLHPGLLGRAAVEQLLGLTAGSSTRASALVPHTLYRRDSTRRP